MTPEEHIERAEWLLALDNGNDRSVAAAAVHVAIADHKKKYPPDGGRPLQRFPMGQIGVSGTKPYPALPDDHPMNKGRPISDNPQA